MKRQNSQQLVSRRREVVSLTHKGWTQAAIASHLSIPQATVPLMRINARYAHERECPSSRAEPVLA